MIVKAELQPALIISQSYQSPARSITYLLLCCWSRGHKYSLPRWLWIVQQLYLFLPNTQVPLIGPEWSRDRDPGLWLAETGARVCGAHFTTLFTAVINSYFDIVVIIVHPNLCKLVSLCGFWKKIYLFNYISWFALVNRIKPCPSYIKYFHAFLKASHNTIVNHLLFLIIFESLICI